MEQVDCIVIGAGVIGLAISRHLAVNGREVFVLESEEGIGNGTSSRNSEVIHAGLYYKPGTLKAQLCVEGNAALYAYCEAHKVNHRRCGKLLVATHEDQEAALGQVFTQAKDNGVPGIRMLSAAEAKALEPELHCVAALHPPSPGIVDSHGLMKAMLLEAEDHGATLVLSSPVTGGEAHPEGVVLELGGEEPTTILAKEVYNCAGLHAQEVARMLRGIDQSAIPPIHFAKGNYYGFSGAPPFSHLVYPVPEAAGLGVHLTLDLGGRARFGPDVEWVDAIDYDVDPRRADIFYAEIRKYWPDLPNDALQPAYAGIRPKLQGPGGPTEDFLIQRADQHGISGLVNLFGIESPGLTAGLTIASHAVNGA